MSETAEQLAAEVIDFLYGRKGFDDWWSDIRPADKSDILHRLAEIIADKVSEERRGDF